MVRGAVSLIRGQRTSPSFDGDKSEQMKKPVDLNDPKIQRRVRRWKEEGVTVKEIQRRLHIGQYKYYRYFPAVIKRSLEPRPVYCLTEPSVVRKVEALYAQGASILEIRSKLHIGHEKWRLYFSYLSENRRSFERGWGKARKIREMIRDNPNITNKEINQVVKCDREWLRKQRVMLGVTSPEETARINSVEEHRKDILRAIYQNPTISGKELAKIVGISPSRACRWLRRYKAGEFERYFDQKKGSLEWLNEPAQYAEVDDFIQAAWKRNDCMGLQLTQEEYERYKELFLLRRRGLQWSSKGIKKMSFRQVVHVGAYKRGKR